MCYNVKTKAQQSRLSLKRLGTGVVLMCPSRLKDKVQIEVSVMIFLLFPLLIKSEPVVLKTSAFHFIN